MRRIVTVGGRIVLGLSDEHFLAFAQNVWIKMIHLYIQTKMTPLGYRAEHDVMISKTCFAIYDFI